MNLSLRAKLRLAESCSNDELQEACNRYYSIYKGVMESANNPAVAEIAKNKLADLVESARQEGIYVKGFEECSLTTTTPNMNASVEVELSSLSGNISPEKAAYLNKKIAALPHSAKRFYLSALVILESSATSPESFHEAVKNLKSAISEDPDNLIYTALLANIEEEIVSYNSQLAQWQKEKQAEIDRQHAISVTKEVFSTIGSVLLWIGGALLTVAGVVASCVCGMCDAC